MASSENSLNKVADDGAKRRHLSRTPFANIGNVEKKPLCVLCRKNGEPPEVYLSHRVKSGDGKTTCPILRKYICELCGATGDYAHTRSHCPQNVGNENIAYSMPKFRILSNGKATKILGHK